MTRVAAVPARFHLRLLALLAALAAALAVSAVVATPSVRAGGPPPCDVTAQATALMGEAVTVTGTGFTPNTGISISLVPPNNPGGVQSGTTDGSGTFEFTFTPNWVGTWTVLFDEVGECSDSTTIGVTCVVDLSATPSSGVLPGDTVIVTGTGFAPSATIVLGLTPPGNPGGVQSGTTDGSGTFVFSFVPDAVGSWLVDFSQANGCADSVSIAVGAAGASPTPGPSGSGLPDAATAQPATTGAPLAVTLLLGLFLLLMVATARSRRPA